MRKRPCSELSKGLVWVGNRLRAERVGLFLSLIERGKQCVLLVKIQSLSILTAILSSNILSFLVRSSMEGPLANSDYEEVTVELEEDEKASEEIAKRTLVGKFFSEKILNRGAVKTVLS